MKTFYQFKVMVYDAMDDAHYIEEGTVYGMDYIGIVTELCEYYGVASIYYS